MLFLNLEFFWTIKFVFPFYFFFLSWLFSWSENQKTALFCCGFRYSALSYNHLFPALSFMVQTICMFIIVQCAGLLLYRKKNYRKTKLLVVMLDQSHLFPLTMHCLVVHNAGFRHLTNIFIYPFSDQPYRTKKTIGNPDNHTPTIHKFYTST